jgi:hypothetical protein
VRDVLFAGLVVRLLLLTGWISQGPDSTESPTPSPTASRTETSLPADTPSGKQTHLDLTGLDVVPALGDIVPTRTPEPTATLDALTEENTNSAQGSGLAGIYR